MNNLISKIIDFFRIKPAEKIQKKTNQKINSEMKYLNEILF